MATQPKSGDTVWVACRAKNACEGQQAEIVFIKGHGKPAHRGAFNPIAGGRTIRYKCLECGQPFHITT